MNQVTEEIELTEGKKGINQLFDFFCIYNWRFRVKTFKVAEKMNPKKKKEKEKEKKNEHVRLKWDMGETTSTLDGIKTNDHGHDRLL